MCSSTNGNLLLSLSYYEEYHVYMGVQIPLWEPTLIFLVYILRKGILEYDRLNIWPGISLWYLGWCKWSSCLSFLSSWAHRLATVSGSSSVLWGTSTMLFMMVSFGLPSYDAQQYVFWTLLVKVKEAKKVCVQQEDHTQFGGDRQAFVRVDRDEPVISAADRWLLRWGCQSSERSGPGGRDHILSQLSFELPVSNVMSNSPVSFVLRCQHQTWPPHCSLLEKGTPCSRESSQQRVIRVGLEFSPWVNVWPWQGRCLLLSSISSFIKDSMQLLILSLWCYCWIWDSVWKKCFLNHKGLFIFMAIIL